MLAPVDRASATRARSRGRLAFCASGSAGQGRDDFAPIVNATASSARPVSRWRRSPASRETGSFRRSIGSGSRVVPATVEHDRARATVATFDRGPVALFPTCLVEYPGAGHRPGGRRRVERNGFTCELPEGQVCVACRGSMRATREVSRARAAQRRRAPSSPPVEAGRSIGRGLSRRAPYVLKDEYPRSSAAKRRRRSRRLPSTRPSSS